MAKEYILFDLDGTLTDPKEGITKSVAYALDHYGIHVEDLDTLIPFIGPPLTDSYEKFYGFPKSRPGRAFSYTASISAQRDGLRIRSIPGSG